MAERDKGSIVRWDPFAEAFDWVLPRTRMRDLLDPFWSRGEAAELMPASDICEDDGHYVVTAELPGMKRDDVTVEMSEGVLTIHGEKKSEHEEKKERRRYIERKFGSFTREFTLPSDANPERVQANFKDGVLTVTIDKTAEKKPRTIDVKAG